MLAAARLKDPHICNASDPKPHTGGPILPPAFPAVLIGNSPAARLSDYALCAGGPVTDVIAMGASTVLIGGLPAARVTDKTMHGGQIDNPGEPTVRIGGPVFHVPGNIIIGDAIHPNPARFQSQVIRDLYLLSTTPSGQKLLDGLEATGQPIKINCSTSSDFGRTDKIKADDQVNAEKGVPTGSTITYNPDLASQSFDMDGKPMPAPPQIALFHEMCHAFHTAKGDEDQNQERLETGDRIQRSETQAIGIGTHKGESPSENSIRDELGLHERRDHKSADDPSLPPAKNLRPGGDPPDPPPLPP
jgi:uncharacterized Zn-binding protein involved in type VI secretion